ncbi:MAG: hypothetical protein IIA87_01375 [Nanoarchaeota archaeon]|nr:hypothetical protein [Nanoarchaeota archaeon]
MNDERLVDKERLVKIVEDFRGRVAVVGDAMLDGYLEGVADRFYQERPGRELFTVVGEQRFVLGGMLNVAKNVMSLGGTPIAFGVIGDDMSGREVVRLCEEDGIEFHCVKDGQTLLKQRRVELTHNDILGRTDFGELVKGKDGEFSSRVEGISESIANELYEDISSRYYDGFILSSYDKRIFRDEDGNFLSRPLIQFARDRGIPIYADPKPEDIRKQKFLSATLISPNESEAREVSGPDSENRSIEYVARRVQHVSGVDCVVITRGKDGMVIHDDKNKRFYEIQTYAREVIDVTGAGDTVIATLMLARLAGANLLEAGQIANYAAGIACGKLGTYAVEKKELIDRIKSA